ncbi:amidohydrolase [Fusibacter ferrireducens]|uniref:Amidohydrolase n=1 Tax=Fusibacter ferrireducens TaxID=2785058 RepID=A0ABR9ZYU0_9FIRM|nr:amidohydrolase [Fusibacter ferrireducens]MBF4695541.1 amidohydrolase [Fusibacter ferrireducens]
MTGILAQKGIEEMKTPLYDLAKKIWENPETAYNEVKASQWTADFLEAQGFEVERKYVGLPTAIKATWGSGKPIIGFLGEYDALPGMSQKISTIKEPIIADAPGQGCGHNLLGVAHVGAVLGMKKEMEEKKLKGTIIYYGCPAEEVLTGKGFMARGGAFKELDIALAWHPGSKNKVTTGVNTGLNTVKFHFKGQTAHAGGDPQNGRSALDALELMNVGTQYLREHVTDDVRIHYITIEGGVAPNIVPDKASSWYFVRALSREVVVETYNRLLKVAKGAAMMTETEVGIEFLGGCYNTLQNKVLVNLIHETMQEVGAPDWTESEIQFAEALNKVSANYDKLVSSGKIPEGMHIHSEIEAIVDENGYGSTDVGDVQHIVPGVMFTTATNNIGAAGHSWQITASSGSSIGEKGMIMAAKVMAIAGIKAIENPKIIQEAKLEFDEVMHGKTYRCPMTDEITIPLPK